MVRNAICAGITNDLGSGSNVDVYIIHKDKPDVEKRRGYEEIAVKGVRYKIISLLSRRSTSHNYSLYLKSYFFCVYAFQTRKLRL